MCPCGHQCCQNGWSDSDTSTLRKPCAWRPGDELVKCACNSLRRSMSNESEPLDPLISNVSEFLRPGQKRDASMMPTAPPLKSTSASTESSTSTVVPPRSLMNVRVVADTASISPTG